jgi:hypothetical protein
LLTHPDESTACFFAPASEIPQLLTAKVNPGDRLKLSVDNGGDGNAWDHADWADPTFFCS